jgi:hypothetical protein
MANKRIKVKAEEEHDEDTRLEQLLAVLPVCFQTLTVGTTTSLLARFAASAKRLQEIVSQ